jgi:hypothetical protein
VAPKQTDARIQAYLGKGPGHERWGVSVALLTPFPPKMKKAASEQADSIGVGILNLDDLPDDYRVDEKVLAAIRQELKGVVEFKEVDKAGRLCLKGKTKSGVAVTVNSHVCPLSHTLEIRGNMKAVRIVCPI